MNYHETEKQYYTIYSKSKPIYSCVFGYAVQTHSIKQTCLSYLKLISEKAKPKN